MTELTLETKIFNYVIESDTINQIKIAKSKYRVNGELKSDLRDLICEKHLLKAADAVDFFILEDDQQNKIINNIQTMIRDTLRPKMQVSNNVVPLTTANPADLIPCLDLETEAEYVMLSLKTGWTSTTTYKSWREMMPKELIPEYMKSKKFCMIKYKPYSLEKFKDVASKEFDGNILEINSCVQPEWRYEKKSKILDPIFKEFFEKLFTTPASLDYAINWIHESIYGRNGTYMVLNGRKGIGKNILGLACSKMVGVRNYNEAPRSALTKEFNSYLRDKRLVLMDEISFRDKKEKDKLKSYLNTFQSVEGKGVDAKMVELHCSIILSSNNSKDCNIEPDDRRFSVMDLSQKPLLEVLGEEKIEKLVTYIESEDFPKAFDDYLNAHRDKKFNPNRPYIGPTFKELCVSTLPLWQASIYEAITSGERIAYTLNDLATPESREFFPRRYKDYITFLANFTIDGKYLGRFERGDTVMTSEIIPSDKYKPESKDDLD